MLLVAGAAAAALALGNSKDVTVETEIKPLPGGYWDPRNGYTDKMEVTHTTKGGVTTSEAKPFFTPAQVAAGDLREQGTPGLNGMYVAPNTNLAPQQQTEQMLQQMMIESMIVQNQNNTYAYQEMLKKFEDEGVTYNVATGEVNQDWFSGSTKDMLYSVALYGGLFAVGLFGLKYFLE
jgi:hypothetical protein